MMPAQANGTTEPDRSTAKWHHAAGVGAILLATLFWSFGGVFGRKAAVSGLVLTFWRMWMGAGLFLVIALALHRLPSWADIRRSAIAGVTFGLNVATFFTAIETISVASTLIIAAVAPVLAMPISIAWFGERLTRTKAAVAAIAVAGVIVAILAAPGREGGGPAGAAGYLWATASLLLWLAYLLLAKDVRRDVGTVPFLLSVSVVGALAVSVAVVATGDSVGAIEGRGWGWVMCLALGPGVFGHGLVAWAQPRVDASVTAVLIQAEPVFASINAWIFLAESVSVVQGIAGLVVIVALGALAYSEAREPRGGPSTVPFAPLEC